MTQVTIYCSRDLEGRVVHALDHADVDTYLQLGGATAHRFVDKGQVPRTIGWEASVFHVPGLDEERTRRLVEQIEEYAGDCEVAPCLRIVVAPVLEVH